MHRLGATSSLLLDHATGNGHTSAVGTASNMLVRRWREADCRKHTSSVKAGPGRSKMPSPVEFLEPPQDLPAGVFERPTPLLLVAGECQPAQWWDATRSFFSRRGCTVGVMALTGRGITSTDKLTLKALQAGVAAGVERSGLTPPVLVAPSIAGFVCQQYLQSYAASGLVLLDPYPPDPAQPAIEFLTTALTADRRRNQSSALADVVPPQGIAELVKDDPTRWEGMLWRYCQESRGDLRWVGAQNHRDDHDSPSRPRFPARAMGEMCVGLPSAKLRLERHVVDTLLIGSERVFEDESAEATRLESLAATGNFHGCKDWKLVDSGGGPEAWWELVWEWYDERF